MAILPGRTGTGANVATIDIGGATLTSPMQFGPSNRMPWLRANVTRSSWRTRPSGPSSAKPADRITTAAAPTAAASARTSGTASAGTDTMTRSTEVGSADNDG